MLMQSTEFRHLAVDFPPFLSSSIPTSLCTYIYIYCSFNQMNPSIGTLPLGHFIIIKSEDLYFLTTNISLLPYESPRPGRSGTVSVCFRDAHCPQYCSILPSKSSSMPSRQNPYRHFHTIFKQTDITASNTGFAR